MDSFHKNILIFMLNPEQQFSNFLVLGTLQINKLFGIPKGFCL